MNSQWPIYKENTFVRVLVHKETDTHNIDFTEDGILAISAKTTDNMSEYVKRSAHEPGYAALNAEGIDALWEALKDIRLMAS